MDASHYLKLLVKYNHWANSRIAEVLINTPGSALNQEMTNSFSSIRKTVYHIWDAEFIWLSRIQGESLTSFPSKLYDDQLPINKFLSCSSDWMNAVFAQKNIFFNQVCHYKNLQQKEFTSTHAEIIMHCMNHSTYHRGQLVTLLRQVGQTELPSTDLISFLREEKD